MTQATISDWERGHWVPAPVMQARLIAALEMLADKRETNPPKKHGNIPL